MRLALLAAVLAATSTPVFAGTPAHSFTADGTDYRYTATRDAHGVVHLKGTAGIDPFQLEVRGNHASGTMGISSVAFVVPSETLARLDAEVPANGAPAVVRPTLAAN
jgi:hypothetical protein